MLLAVSFPLWTRGDSAGAVSPDFTLFAEPPQEPTTPTSAGLSMPEASFVSGLHLLTGLGAVLLRSSPGSLTCGVLTVVGACWALDGLTSALFGTSIHCTSIGLVVNAVQPPGAGRKCGTSRPS